MSASCPRLTAAIHAEIAAFLRAGGFPWVAAEAAGVPIDTFHLWLERGLRPGAREPYRSFAQDVQRALAQARLKAESDVFSEDPRTWLRHGPGKEAQRRPGWSGLARAGSAGQSAAPDVFGSAEFLAFLATLRRILAPYPDALAALAAALGAREPPTSPSS